MHFLTSQMESSLVVYLLFFLGVAQLSSGKKVISLYKNGGDILQLRNRGNRMFNALKKTSTEKWNIRDNGNYVIPYTITGHYDRRELANIRKAMSRIEANTCIRFRERTRERDYIEIQNQAGQGCYTNVGRIGGRGIVMLESNYRETCTEPETVIHELLHVTGLWHEHMRYDRDQYIKVHYENIDRGYWSQFEKVKPWEATTYNIPYDYKSIMHYEKSAFAYEGKISMETLDPRYQNVIGRQKDASPSDYRKVCEIYQCSQCMNGNTDIDVQKPDPVTVKPFPSTKRGCRDLNPRFCKTLARARLIDCSFYGRQQCCATCAERGFRSENESPFDSFYRMFDYWDNFRF